MSLSRLMHTTGLGNFNFLEDKDKKKVKSLEESRNTGIFNILEKRNVLLLTHTKEFRLPASPIVVNGTFPAIKFPEIPGAVSASPGKEVHNYLVNRFNLILKDEATVLVGWD